MAYVCLRLTVMLLSDKNNQANFENDIYTVSGSNWTDITIKKDEISSCRKLKNILSDYF